MINFRYKSGRKGQISDGTISNNTCHKNYSEALLIGPPSGAKMSGHLHYCGINKVEACYTAVQNVENLRHSGILMTNPQQVIPYQKDISTVLSVQRRCTQFVYNNHSPYASATDMLEKLNYSPLVDCRKQLKAITMF